MGNGKKARFERIPRPAPPEPKPAMRNAAEEAIAKAGEENTLPESFVVVLAYNRTDEDTSEEFVKMVEDFKALFSLRDGMRAYALVDDAASEVLSVVEKPVSNG
jgi:hypothetical protein